MFLWRTIEYYSFIITKHPPYLFHWYIITLSDCEEPNAPGYGSFDLAVDKMAAQFSCLTGYTLRGAEILTCQSDGSGWDIAPPVCGKFL